jgi:ribosomal-protein-alanine N-acetyltransferase
MKKRLPPVFLTGTKVELRPLVLSDLKGDYLEWLNSPETNAQTSRGRFPVSRAAAEAYVERVARSEHDLVLAIVERKTGKHVGNIALQRIHWVDRSAEYAILLGDSSARGKGFGSEASLLLVKHGFSALGLHRIYCGTTSENLGMQKLAKTMKMKAEGRQRQAVYKNGRHLDVLLFGVLKNEFFSKKNS